MAIAYIRACMHVCFLRNKKKRFSFFSLSFYFFLSPACLTGHPAWSNLLELRRRRRSNSLVVFFSSSSSLPGYVQASREQSVEVVVVVVVGTCSNRYVYCACLPACRIWRRLGLAGQLVYKPKERPSQATVPF